MPRRSAEPLAHPIQQGERRHGNSSVRGATPTLGALTLDPHSAHKRDRPGWLDGSYITTTQQFSSTPKVKPRAPRSTGSRC